MDEVPEVSGDSSKEYAENGIGSVATYTATDPEGTAIVSWMVGGTDGGAFMIDGGVLRFKKAPDYEMPADIVGEVGSTAAANDNTYEVMVTAMDSTGETGEKPVMVKVTNEEEMGMVELSARQPGSGVVFTATLTDPDSVTTENPTGLIVSGTTWQWESAPSKNGSYTDIDGAMAATYTPTDAAGKSDNGRFLRATVSYNDGEGSDKTAMMTSEYAVQALRGTNNAPKFADDQDPVMAEEQHRGSENSAGEHRSRDEHRRPGGGHGRRQRCADLHANRRRCRNLRHRLGDGSTDDQGAAGRGGRSDPLHGDGQGHGSGGRAPG